MRGSGRKRIVTSAGLILLLWSAARSSPSVGANAPEPVPPAAEAAAAAAQSEASARLARLVEEDQVERRLQPVPADLDARDQRRRDEITRLVREGLLGSAEDWVNAGLIFQHSHSADDVLVAHVLFTVAALEGHAKARFLFAASLDRLLTHVDRPQFFATQPQDDGHGDWMMPPAHPLLSPLLRQKLNVPSEADLAKRIDLWRAALGKKKEN